MAFYQQANCTKSKVQNIHIYTDKFLNPLIFQLLGLSQHCCRHDMITRTLELDYIFRKHAYTLTPSCWFTDESPTPFIVITLQQTSS